MHGLDGLASVVRQPLRLRWGLVFGRIVPDATGSLGPNSDPPGGRVVFSRHVYITCGLSRRGKGVRMDVVFLVHVHYSACFCLLWDVKKSRA